MRRAILAAAAIVFWPGYTVYAQEGILDLHYETIDLVTSVEDLVFLVEDIGGAVVGLAITETETEIRFDLSGDVLFDFDKADIKPEAEPVLAEVAGVLKQHTDAAVLIGGHTDALGSDSYNLRLSQQRADSVKGWLVETGGVDGRRLATRGFGSANPVAPNTHPDGSDNPEGRQQNRRVEIALRK